MPSFDLRGIKIAKYGYAALTGVAYTNAQTVGDAMNVNLEMRYAEGRLYAESTLAEYMRKATGGTISIGVKYIPNAAQKILFGSRENARSITYTPAGGTSTTESVTGLAQGAKSDPGYVGVAFYAPDMVDGNKKYTCVKIARALFGTPSMSFQTAGENIQYNTPTTTGEFLADGSSNQDMIEVATVDYEEAAIAWVEAVLS